MKESDPEKGPRSSPPSRKKRAQDRDAEQAANRAFRDLLRLNPGTLAAIQELAKVKPAMLKAIQDTAALNPETLRALQNAAGVKIDPEILKTIQEFSSIRIPSSSALERTLKGLRQPTWQRFPGVVKEDEATERHQRAWRNALVHAAADEPGKDPSAPETRAQPPPSKSAPEQKLRSMAPPAGWPNSWQARRVRKAARDKTVTEVIVLAADIRHSTDLMKEAVNQYVFAATLEAFVAASRECIWRNRGWYANFTGDGFLAFWPVTDPTHTQAVRRALTAVSELFEEFEVTHVPQFASNAWQFREDTGLCVGLDHGDVAIVEVGAEATIVGRSVVGATRLVAAGFEWEVLANNHLGGYLANQAANGALPGVDLQKVIVPTKDSQFVRAYSVAYEWKQRPLHPRTD